MSRLGKKPLPIPDKVKVEFNSNDHALKITGPMGTMVQKLNPRVTVKIEKNQLTIEPLGNSKEDNMIHGLMRGIVKNDLEGVVHGYKKDLEIQGLGYKAALEGKNLNLNIGFSHPIVFPIPEGIKITVDKQTLLSITGIDKTLVGETAARIRLMKPPEPYGGTGVRYVGEHIIRKAGKAAAGAAGGGAGGKK